MFNKFYCHLSLSFAALIIFGGEAETRVLQLASALVAILYYILDCLKIMLCSLFILLLQTHVSMLRKACCIMMSVLWYFLPAR